MSIDDTALAHDIEKAYRRHEHQRRTGLPVAVKAKHVAALEQKLTAFFARVRPRIVAALAKGASHVQRG